MRARCDIAEAGQLFSDGADLDLKVDLRSDETIESRFKFAYLLVGFRHSEAAPSL